MTVVKEAKSTLVEYEEDRLWSEILPNLWQGGTDDADCVDSPRGRFEDAFISREDFDTVVTLHADAQPAGWFVRELRCGFWDTDTITFDPEEIFDIVKIAHKDWKRGKNVLVRCQAGWNRSGLVMALILIRDGFSAKDAIALIRRKRSSWALCNKSFEKWLISQNPAAWQGDSYAG